MSYVLKLCGWYPSDIDAYNGDFVQRHALSIATQKPVVVLFAAKDVRRRNGGIKLVRTTHHNLTEFIAYYPARNWLDTWWSQYYYLQVLFKILPQLRSEFGDPALVHVNIAWKPAIWAAFITKKYHWPLVVTENSTEYQPEARLHVSRVGVLRRHLTARLFRECKLFVPVSRQLGEQVQALFGKIPFTVVPNAVNTQLFFPVPKPTGLPFRIVHVSTLTYQKNAEGLLKVFDAVLQKFPHAELVIVGPITPLLLQWQNHWKEQEFKVRCTGLIPYEAVAKQLQQADVLVLFSRYENLPCVILEAHCCGVPVVSTHVGGIAEVINKTNGLLVPSGDEAALFNAVSDIITQKIIFEKEVIAENARAMYNYEQIGKSFVQAYKIAGITI